MQTALLAVGSVVALGISAVVLLALFFAWIEPYIGPS
jgi:hypothetical protein